MEGRGGEGRREELFQILVVWFDVLEGRAGDGSKFSNSLVSNLLSPESGGFRGERIFLLFGLDNPIKISSLVEPTNIFKSLTSPLPSPILKSLPSLR